MPSSDKERDFTAYEESNYPGMIIPEMFNNTGDAGDGNPGMQRAIRNWTTWWLHSGNMDSGLHVAGYDITGVENIFASTITGQNISGDLISGTRGYFTTDLTGIKGYFTTDLTGVRGNFTTDLTGVKGKFVEITGTTSKITTANITNAVITNAIQDINFGDTYDIKGVAEITGISGNIGDLQSTSLDNLLIVGVDNKQWQSLKYIGSSENGTKVSTMIDPAVGSPTYMTFDFPLQYVKGNKNLIITSIKVGIYAADASNYITQISLYGWTGYSGISLIESNDDDYNSAQEVTWNCDDLTVGDTYKRIFIRLAGMVASQQNLRIAYVQAEYYYT